MPAASTAGAKQTVEVGRPGEYAITIGDTLKRSLSESPDLYTSVKYNYKPGAALQNTVPPRLTKHAPSGEAPYTLTLSPPATAQNAAPSTITYTGSQHVHVPRKTECILLFDPTTQTFTLEKLSSTFTFNAKVYALAHPPLPLRPPIPDGEDDDASAGEKEDDNPFDYRHFVNKKTTRKTRAEQKAEREQRRKEALKRAGKDVPEDDEPEEEEEEDLGLGISYNGRPVVSGKGFLASPAIGPKKVGGKSPFAGKKPMAMSPGVPLPSPAHGRDSSSDEDESEEADDEDEGDDEETVPPRAAPAKKPPVARGAAAMEEASEEESSDEDAPAPPPLQQQQQQPQEEEDEDDDFGLAELLEKELENEDDGAGGDVDADGDIDLDTEIIFEDEDTHMSRPKNVGLGIATTGGGDAPTSFARMMGGGDDDDSETSEEE